MLPEDAAPESPDFLLPVARRILDEGMEPPPLFHYTDQAGFLGILSSGCMWSTLIQYLNDSREYEHGIRLITEELQRRANEEPELQERLATILDPGSMAAWSTSIVGVISFSGVRDDLSQWRAYAGGSGGYCIGFDGPLLLRQVNSAAGVLVRVRYGNAQHPEEHAAIVNEFCDQLIAELALLPSDPEALNAGFSRRLTSVQVVCSVLKDHAFAAEEEWRAIHIGPAGQRAKLCIRGGQSTLIPYYEVQLRNDALAINRLPLSEIIVGPTPHEAAAQKAASVAMHYYGEPCQVSPTVVPFRNW